MRKPIVFVAVKPLAAALLVALFLTAAAIPPLAATWRGRNGPLHNCRVLIDPGHGGIDPGTGAQLGILEKDINLDIAHRLFHILDRMGGEVALTRWHDQELSFLLPHEPVGRHGRDLRGRAHLAETFNAGIVVSLHVNFTRSREERGSIVFFCRDSRDGQALGEAIQRRFLAIQPYSRQKALPNSRWTMLKSTPCPSVLVEVGFLSNPEDRALLANAKYRDKLARAVAEGIKDYVTGTNGKAD